MMLIATRTRLIVISILMGIWNNVEAKQVSLDIDENLLLKICRMKFCATNMLNQICNLDFCIERMADEQKPGDCSSAVNTSLGQSQCFDDCNGHDYRCVATQKCCPNGCHRICDNAHNLNGIDESVLPTVPFNVSVSSMESEMRRKVRVAWEMPQLHERDIDLGTVDFIIEARVHVGHTFSAHKLSHWYVVYSTERETHQRSLGDTVRISSLLALKIGRWYEYRVAAINRNGTRGYSHTSKPFQLNEVPKTLPSPTNFTIDASPKLLPNNSVYTRVAWMSPITDYPIEKFEFTWSFYIREGEGSLFMEKALVPETRRFFEFWDLLPNSYYYLQVHAVSSFGRKRLKSGKVWLFLNTTELS